jgi:hypothetical protein
MRSFYENEKLDRIMNGAVAGQGTSYSDAIDVLGHDSVTLVFAAGAIVATGTIVVTAQQGSEANGGDAADLAAAVVNFTAADGEKLALIEIYRPRERYVRLKVVRAVANSVIDGAFAILRDAKKIPITQSSDVVGSVILGSPAEA